MRRLIAIFSLLLAIPSVLQAGVPQADSLATIDGRTIYKYDDKAYPASAVLLRLISGKDTLNTQSAVDGSFRFENVRPGKKRILAKSAMFKMTQIDFEVFAGSNALMVEMVRDIDKLTAAVISAYATPMVQRGDTIIFNSAAVKTMQGENAIEILRQMPGVEIKDDVIYVNGQKVERAYVNGLLLFGNDPMSPLNSILAEDVTHIATYEELDAESRRRGNKHGKKERVLDIRTREPIVSAWDAFAQAKGGADETLREDGRLQGRYFAGANANFFSERFLVFANAFSNNLDLDRNTLNIAGDRSLKHYNRKSTGSVGLEKYWGDRLLGNHIHLDYAYNDNLKRSFNRSLLTYQDPDGTPSRTLSDTTQSQNTTGSHRFVIQSSVNDTRWKNWEFNSVLQLDDTRQQKFDKQWNRLATGGDYHLIEEYGSKTSSIHGRGMLRWSDQYTQSRVSPMAMLTYTINPSEGENWTIDTLASSLNRRYISAQSSGNNIDLNAETSAHIQLLNNEESTSFIIASYSIGYNRNHTRQIALDLYDAAGRLAEPATNEVNTYDFTRNYIQHGPALTYYYYIKDFSLNIGTSAQFATQKDIERYPLQPEGSRNFFLPGGWFSIQYKLFALEYTLFPSLPAVEQYRDRLDDSNPFFLIAGNPDLKPSLQHRFRLSGSVPVAKKATSIYYNADVSIASNAIVDTKTYFPTGETIARYGYNVLPTATLSSFENCSGKWSANLTARFTKRLQPAGLSLSIGCFLDYSQNPYFQNDEKVYVQDISPAVNTSLDYRPNKSTNCSLNYYLGYTESTNSLQQVLTQALRNSLSFKGTYNIGKYWFVGANYDLRSYSYINSTFDDVTTHYLSAKAGVRLMNGRLRITLSGNDLLNNGYGYGISTANDYVRQVWTPSYGRYYLLSVSWRLNKLQSATNYQGRLYDGVDFVGFGDR
jgi:hypothetical protein